DVMSDFCLPKWIARKPGTFRAALIAVALMEFMAVGVTWAQDADNGHRIAERWCSSCHAVDKHAANPTPAPAFADIAARHPNDEKWLRAWLMTPHPSMPDLNLSRREIEDLVAYLRSVRRP